MKSFSAQDRTVHLQRMQTERFDLVIVGGGINGAGIARDACLRGMKVALIEANDFASGTSSRSSKLIHGGIRYLENMEFRLVFEALSERHKLLQMAPHLVHPLKFLIPVYAGGRVSANMMGLGMWLYDALSLFDAPESHERLHPAEAIDYINYLQPQGLQAAFTYYDAYMDDDRLVLETLRSANEAGLCAANYVKATGCGVDKDGVVQAITVRDLKTNKEFMIRGDHFVSTVGPWVDELGSSFFKDWKKKLRPTKGIHLTFARERFPLSCAVVMAAEQRIVFAIPRHEMVIVGTTDTDFNGDLNRVFAQKDEVQYLLQVVEKYFPGLKVTAQDIVSTYAGVRPLVDDGAKTEGKTSREHTILTDDHGITYVMGGKYTTYRKIAEQALSEILKHFPFEKRVQWGLCQTDQPLNPLVSAEILDESEEYTREMVERSGLSEAESLRLFERHGLEALQMPKSFGRLRSGVEYEASHALMSTMCLSLRDFYFRRVPLFLAEPDHGLRHLESIANIFSSFYNWSAIEKADQLEDLQAQIRAELGWQK